MSQLPHTLDNLCKKEKDRVVEMLKQLNELKKRCNALEQQLEAKQLENERLAGRDEVMTKQLETTHAKLLESIELSKDSQAQIEQLSLKLQKSEAEKKALNARVKEAQAESQSLKENVRKMRMKHEKIMVTASVQCRFVTCDKSCNTQDSALDLQNAAVQVPVEASFAQPVMSNISQMPKPESFTNSREVSSFMMGQESSITMNPACQTEADEDLTQLICILNQI